MTGLDDFSVTSIPLPPLRESVPAWRGGRYRGYAELTDGFGALVADGARRFEIGLTVAGIPVVGLDIGDPDARRASVLLGGMHAMEWIGVEIGMALARRYLRSHANGRVPGRRLLYVPLVNVDGYRAVEDDLRQGRWWSYRRGNRQGVDLNRNWPTHHRVRYLPGLVVPPLGTAGPTPLSEPEPRAVCRWLDGFVDEGVSVDRALSLHSIGRKILMPYGGRWRRPARFGDYRNAARRIRGGIGVRYKAMQCSRWMPGAFAHGIEIDHLHERYRARSLLVECSWGGVRPLDPRTWFTPFCWYNPRDPVRETGLLVSPLLEFLAPTV
jgi:hypothetical protein